MIASLTIEQRATALKKLTAWRFDEGRNALFRRIEFADFSACWDFMTRVAIAAERADHHPEWTNVYNRVDIWLTTHDADGISARDIDLAKIIDELAAATVQ